MGRESALIIDNEAELEGLKAVSSKGVEESRIKSMGLQDNVVRLDERNKRDTVRRIYADHVFVRRGVGFNVDDHECDPEELERMTAIKRELGDAPVCCIENRPVYRFAKRAFDIVFSAAVLVCFSWLFLIIAIAIKIDDPKGPVFFKQERCGRLGKDGNPTTFKMWKFRSMCVDAEEKLAELKELNEKTGPVFKMAEDPRITRVGKWLRKLSLDELPQFFNTLGW